jgi:phospholipid/cholesterol/gamma-HCH transport system ATP-binding protein
MSHAAAPEALPEVVIEVRDLVTHYGDREILHGVDMDVRRGEIMVIMGGSGSGKSTLLRHMLRLEQATSDLEWFDFSRNLGVAFQGGALFSSMSVGDNVMLPLRERTSLDESTMRIMMRLKLEVVSLSGFEDLMPAELSGGMIKRAAFARAVVMDPTLLFCDEPSAGLDPVVSAGLDELILRLRDALGMTIVVVTHELDSAFRIADRMTVLDRGEVLAVGSAEEIRAHPSSRVQDLLQRRFEEEELDADAYLERLTAGPGQGAVPGGGSGA